jgi:hypothetical protein
MSDVKLNKNTRSVVTRNVDLLTMNLHVLMNLILSSGKKVRGIFINNTKLIMRIFWQSGKLLAEALV